MLAHVARVAAAASLLLFADADASANANVLIGDAACQRPEGPQRWTLHGKLKLGEVLRAYAGLGCDTLLVDTSVLAESVTLDVPGDEMSAYQLRQRVREALRENGVALDSTLVFRARRLSEAETVTKQKLDAGIQCKKEGCTVARSLLSAWLADPEIMLSQARMVPHVADGKPDGIKLFAIRPGSVLARLGFLNGDLMKTCNGINLASPEGALEGYAKLRTAEAITVELERAGKPLTLSYTIK